MSLLNQFLFKLTHLKRANTVYGKAPHKPVLLLSIFELIEKRIVKDNHIYVTTDLVGTFVENWRLLVNTMHSPDFTQPFYYLQSERLNNNQFWFLQPKQGCQINSYIRSVKVLSEVLDYGYFSQNIFLLLCDAISRNLIKNALLDAYFPDKKDAFISAKETGRGYFNDLENYLLNEPEVQYKTLKIDTEEDVFVRGGLFKKLVPKVYGGSCCITGMRLESSFGHSFIDACHIIPFSVSHDDKVNNGVALCPNLHRAFDRGLISIDKNYKVVISPHLIEDSDHAYSLNKLKDVKVRLPSSGQYNPHLPNLDWHRENVFKK